MTADITTRLISFEAHDALAAQDEAIRQIKHHNLDIERFLENGILYVHEARKPGLGTPGRYVVKENWHG